MRPSENFSQRPYGESLKMSKTDVTLRGSRFMRKIGIDNKQVTEAKTGMADLFVSWENRAFRGRLDALT
jgi:hypothetical protein